METYKVLFDPNQNDGVYAISLVNDPAIEVAFIAMSKQSEVKLATVSEEKRILLGAVLIPDQPIFRSDKGKEFNIVFPAETIRQVQQNFSIQGYQNNSTIEHDGKQIENVSFVETWIKEDEVNDKSVKYGFNEPVGTWYATMKVNNDEVWNEYVKTGKVTGFSIDGVFDLERINLNSNYMDFEKLGSSIVDAIQKGFSTKMNTEAPAEITQEPVKMATMLLEDGVTVLEATSFEVGSEVNVVAEDGSKTLAPEGTHKLEDGTTIVVDANGLITEVMPAEIEVEVETEMSTDAKFEALIKSVITNMSTEFGVQLAKVKTELSAEITALKAQKVELTAETKAKPQTNNEPKSAFEKFRNFNKQFN
jgi:hypothetical protein